MSILSKNRFDMKNLNTTLSEKVLSSLNPLQRFWLDLWAELLQPSTIDLHALPPVNCCTLVKDILSLNQENIDDNRKKSLIQGAIDDLVMGQYGIRQDALIKEEFRATVLGEKTPNLNRADIFTLIQYTERIEKNLLEDDIYTKKIILNVYKRISVDYLFKEPVSWHEEIEKLENMTKSMFVELLKIGFSYNYLKMKFASFVREKSFSHDNVQSKIDTLFLGFISEPNDYSLIFRLFDFPKFSSSQKIQNVELLTTIPENILARINGRKENIESELEGIFSTSETELFSRITSYIRPLIGEDQIMREVDNMFQSICNNRKDKDTIEFYEIASFIGYFRRLIEKLRSNYNLKPLHSSSLLTYEDLLQNNNRELYKFSNSFDVDFALSSYDQIKNICELISKEKSTNIY